MLWYQGRLVILAGPRHKMKVIHEFHDTPIGGHSGALQTYKRVAANFYWVGMKRDILEYVRHCDVCQCKKYDSQTPGGLLQPLPIPDRVWEDVFMDFIEGLPSSNGFSVILVVVDRLSKYGHFIALKHPYSAKTVAESLSKRRRNCMVCRIPLFQTKTRCSQVNSGLNTFVFKGLRCI